MSQMKEGLWNKGIPGRGHGICYGLEVEEGVPAVGEQGSQARRLGVEEVVGVAGTGLPGWARF